MAGRLLSRPWAVLAGRAASGAGLSRRVVSGYATSDEARTCPAGHPRGHLHGGGIAWQRGVGAGHPPLAAA
ncbi:hypothetical protein SPHINGO361_140401 [Sphingomonas sp. EC-HK361]|nr:hypothetical protein SPHINGO361_140401 [Sphingomonas sp. EC-HK361]